MCSGAVYPAGTDSAVIATQVCNEHKGPDIPGDVPEHLAAVIGQCLQPDPEKRATAAQVRQVGHSAHLHCRQQAYDTARLKANCKCKQ